MVADGDIDWDQVMNDEDLGDYLDWNDELATLRSNVEIALDYGARGVRDFILNNQDGNANEDFADRNLTKLPDLMAAIIRYEAGGRRNDENFVSDFIDRRIDVRKDSNRIQRSDTTWIVQRV